MLVRTMDFTGSICLVTGCSRGLGRGIAVQLAYYGAKCYVTGRSLQVLEQISSEVKELGGRGECIAVRCDHSDDKDVEMLFKRIDEENNGKLDLLVNNAYSAAEHILNTNADNFWEQSPDVWDLVNNVGLRNNYRCAVFASRLMVTRRKGLIINVSSMGGLSYFLSPVYGIGKTAKDRMAQDCAIHLKKYNVAFLSLWPSLVNTEEIEKAFERGHLNEISGMRSRCETPTYVGKTVCQLLSEPPGAIMMKTGKILLTSDIGRVHGITDENGVVPVHQFQLKRLLAMSGYTWLAKFCPEFINAPLWLLRMGEAMKHC